MVNSVVAAAMFTSSFYITFLIQTRIVSLVNVQHKGPCLLIQKYFCAVYDYAGKADLSKGY